MSMISMSLCYLHMREGGRGRNRIKEGDGMGGRGEGEWQGEERGRVGECKWGQRDRPSFQGNTFCFSSWRIKCGPCGILGKWSSHQLEHTGKTWSVIALEVTLWDALDMRIGRSSSSLVTQMNLAEELRVGHRRLIRQSTRSHRQTSLREVQHVHRGAELWSWWHTLPELTWPLSKVNGVQVKWRRKHYGKHRNFINNKDIIMVCAKLLSCFYFHTHLSFIPTLTLKPAQITVMIADTCSLLSPLPSFLLPGSLLQPLKLVAHPGLPGAGIVGLNYYTWLVSFCPQLMLNMAFNWCS